MRLAVLSFIAVGAALALSQPAHADNDTACGAVLCLAGEAAGEGGGSGCTGYLASDSGTRSSDNSQFDGQEFGP